MAAILGKEVGEIENKYNYNGMELKHQEFSGGSALEDYDFGALMQDP